MALTSMAGVLSTTTPIVTNIQDIVTQLQKDKYYQNIGKQWIEKLNLEGLALIEPLGNSLLRLKIEKSNVQSNLLTLTIEKTQCKDYIALLQMIIQMKIKEALKAKILQKGDEP